ncbi:N-acetylglutamate synthase-like GNAT family acetyltransferase [Bradyrhizobium sp. USDA 4524]|uniref:GNAT family N-acetyltransferase n=1 Tax=unclassified Bradyrhizobium TaxID=2631580 RepID=UPI00209DC28B|nr:MULTISPECIES: GNAT family N-acetyltransferase [unclassified Bradyrhizobium]MCP1846113.1 N-acetylglutamate synthase-like GNAT family acetyltransferase [Bradyrhizobium sp. USDA 4538]MCP1907252.1 N-acetylglutamate synthase-like GNAT family acetyltransferase [Bradyrhizobium sp. USDA 4537]MCP1985728.1 N-acetylglutamate synthase-like GNAT family acetyltransferase [Bradyrhizobium sp. USDA 4539]
MSVRPATPSDLPVLKTLCAAFRAEHRAGAALPYEPDMFMESLAAAMKSDDVLLLILDDDQGFFLAALGVTPYSTVQVAHELIWYTRPEARGRGFSLFRAYMRWARAKQVEYVFLTLPEPSETMERLGFSRADIGYYMRLPPAA